MVGYAASDKVIVTLGRGHRIQVGSTVTLRANGPLRADLRPFRSVQGGDVVVAGPVEPTVWWCVLTFPEGVLLFWVCVCFGYVCVFWVCVCVLGMCVFILGTQGCLL